VTGSSSSSNAGQESEEAATQPWEAGNLRPGHVRLAEYVRDKGQTCPMKTDLVVLKTSKTVRKIDIQ
jgi:hypothetical protein